MPESSSLPDDIVQSIAISNATSLADEPARLSNLMYANLIQNTNLAQQNAVANQQAMNQLGLSVLGKTIDMLVGRGTVSGSDGSETAAGGNAETGNH